jgi:hypothetical protein
MLNLELLADTYSFTTSTLDLGTGAILTFGPSGPAFPGPFDWQGSVAGLTINNMATLGGLIIGSPTNTANITISNAINIGGQIVLQGGNLAINQALTSTTLTALTATGTISGAGTITTADLLIDNAGSVNGLSTVISANLAVNSAGGVSLSNTGNLVIGSVFATNGINAGGPIDIATTTGNINVSQPVVTTDTSANAIRLNAGQTAGVGGTGTPASGNIDITGAAVGGAIQAGNGGVISLFSGSIAGSASLITKVGGSGSGNFRYNNDEGIPTYTAPLSTSNGAPNTGLNAIFREQPSLTVTPSLHTIVYGDTTPAFTATLAGAVNGDNAAATTSGGATWSVAGGVVSNAGHPLAGPNDVAFTGGLTNSLGYALIDNVGSTNELTVNQKTIFATGITATNRVYDATTAAALVTGGAAVTGGAVNNADNLFYTLDIVTVNAGFATGSFGTKDAGIGKPVSVAGLALTGADGGNYIVVDNSGATADITPKPLNVSGLTSANKVYDGGLTATVGGAAVLTAPQAPGGGLPGVPYTGDTVSVVGPATGTFDTKDVLTATTVSFGGLTLGGAEAGNYSLNAHAPALHSITPAPLVVTAVGATKVVDGVPYAGGNGVSFANFVGGETVAVLGGVLSYAGTSQGATAVGNYLITPLGYTSTNYTVSFVDGALSITAAVAPAPAPAPVVLTPTPVVTTVPTLTTTLAAPTDFTGTSTAPATGTSSPGGTVTSSDPLAGGTSSTAGSTSSTSTSASSTSSTATGTSSTTDPDASGSTASAGSSSTATDETGTGTSGTAATTSTSTTTASGGTTGTTSTPTATSTGGTSTAPTQTATATPPVGTTTTAPPASGTTVSGAGQTTAGVPPAAGVTATQTPPPARAGATTPPAAAPRTVVTAATTPTVEPAVAKPPPAIVTATTTRLASTEAPAQSIDALVTSRVGTAVGGGVSPTTANRAGSAFSTALAQKLAQGQPMTQAMASADRAFQAESSVPPPRTPEVALSRAIAAGGGDVATSLNTVAPSKPGAGSAAFDRSLSAALARGVPMDVAVGAAKVAARQSEQAAIADTTPRAQLASGTAASSSPQSANPAFQKSLSSMLAQGVSPQAAMARAGQAAEADAAAARVDARNPSAGLASGRTESITSATPGGASEQVLALALARGEAPGTAMVRAATIQREEQAAIAADARQPQASLVRGGANTVPERGADFDRALTNALGRGLTPEAALQVANRAADAVAPAPTPASALATGVGIEKIVAPTGSSRAYRAALSTALARGLPVARAIESARRAEDANAFRFAVPAAVPRNLSGAKVTDAAGRPLPSWLQFNPATRQFVATEVPEGGLPIQAVVVVGQTRVPIVISDGPMPPAQRP